MKNWLLSTCLAAIVTVGAVAEANAQTSIGVKGGYSASSLRGKDVSNMNWRNGFAGGLFVNFAVFKAFTIQPEVLFRQRGGSTRNETLDINQRINLSYMDVPVLFKLRLPIDNTFYPHIYVGPQFSYNIKGEYEVGGGDGITVYDDLSVRRVDAGGVMGFGLDIVSNKFFLTTDFRYGLGGFNIDNSDEPFLIKNQDLAIMVGVGFNIGGKD